MSLGSRVVLRYCLSLIITVALLFLPAGTWRFWQAWIFLAIVFAYLMFVFLYFYKHDPQLLERRMQGKEKLAAQKLLIQLWRPAFIAIFLIPGLDHRFAWSRRLLGEVPPWLSVLADVVLLLGFLMVFWVLRVNSFASRTIEVQTGQKLISSGPYALVRHPMYLGSIVLCVSIPLAMGSSVALPAFALAIPFYVARLLDEEKFLRRELPSYDEYCLSTRFRLLPYIW